MSVFSKSWLLFDPSNSSSHWYWYPCLLFNKYEFAQNIKNLRFPPPPFFSFPITELKNKNKKFNRQLIFLTIQITWSTSKQLSNNLGKKKHMLLIFKRKIKKPCLRWNWTISGVCIVQQPEMTNSVSENNSSMQWIMFPALY